MCMFYLLVLQFKLCVQLNHYLYICSVLIGEIDNELDSRLNLAEIRAEPLAQIHH